MIVSWNDIRTFDSDTPLVRICIWDDEKPVLIDPHPIIQWLESFPKNMCDYVWKNVGKKLNLVIYLYDDYIATIFRLRWDGVSSDS